MLMYLIGDNNLQTKPESVDPINPINQINTNPKKIDKNDNTGIVTPTLASLATNSTNQERKMSSDPNLPQIPQIPGVSPVLNQAPTEDNDQGMQSSSKNEDQFKDNPELKAIIAKAIEQHYNAKKRKQHESPKDDTKMDEDPEKGSEPKTKKARFTPETEKPTQQQEQPERTQTQTPKSILSKKDDDIERRRTKESDMLQIDSLTKVLQDLVSMKNDTPDGYYQKQLQKTKEEVTRRNSEILQEIMGQCGVSDPDRLPDSVISELDNAFASEANFNKSPLVKEVLAARGRGSHNSAERNFNYAKNGGQRQQLNGYTGDIPAYVPQKPREISPFESAKRFLGNNDYNNQSYNPRYNPHSYQAQTDDGMEVDIPEQRYQHVPQYHNGVPVRAQQKDLRKSYEQQNASHAQRRMGFDNSHADRIIPKQHDRYIDEIMDFIKEDFGTEKHSPFITTQSQVLNDFKLMTAKIPYLSQGCGGLFGKNVISSFTEHGIEELEAALAKEKVIHPQVLGVVLHNFARGGTGLSPQQKFGLNSSVHFNSFVGEVKPFSDVEPFFSSN